MFVPKRQGSSAYRDQERYTPGQTETMEKVQEELTSMLKINRRQIRTMDIVSRILNAGLEITLNLLEQRPDRIPRVTALVLESPDIAPKHTHPSR